MSATYVVGVVVPETDIVRVADAHERFLDAVRELSDAHVRRASLLPGWTVGHVLTHVARNADSHVRRAEAAVRGDVVDQYDGGYAGREADIEAGAGRSAAELLDDVRRSAAAVDAAWRAASCVSAGPTSAMRLHDLRSRVGLVTQDVQLFAGTLRDNVTMYDDTVTDVELRAVFESLELDRWIDDLPDGLDTELGATARGLSAGEAQLVALARVFLEDPGLVVLDEASSRLDPHTEQLLERAITRLLAGRTAIVIAHRLSTVERADAILILDGGRVAELGPRDALAADPTSRLAQLLRVGMGEVLA